MFAATGGRKTIDYIGICAHGCLAVLRFVLLRIYEMPFSSLRMTAISSSMTSMCISFSLLPRLTS